jgi:lysophospholipase L1-like esterase
MATFLSYEGRVLYDNNAGKVYDRVQANTRPGIIEGFPTQRGNWPTTLNAFLNNGLNNPSRQNPYEGIPSGLYGACKVEFEQIWVCKETLPRPDYYAKLKISDPGGTVLYSTADMSTTTPGVPVNDNDEFNSNVPGFLLKLHEPGMRYTMSMAWTKRSDSVTFKYGSDVRFTANGGGDKLGQCTLQGQYNWDPYGPSATCAPGSDQRRTFACQYACERGDGVLQYLKTDAGRPVKNGVNLRILPVGDSITAGSGNGYRGPLRDRLSKNKVVFAGTEPSSEPVRMDDGYYAAWLGKTIQYISDHAGPSLDQRPNVILFAAGTNDMNEKPEVATEGPGDPQAAVERYGKAVDKMIQKCPDATILVAIIIPTDHSPWRAGNTTEFQKLIPDMVRSRYNAGHKVLAADFSKFKLTDLYDTIHPSAEGYKIMGDMWYSFIHQIPEDWLQNPVGPDPDRSGEGSDSGECGSWNCDVDASRNGGIDENIPQPDWGDTPVRTSSPEAVQNAVDDVKDGEKKAFACKLGPRWRDTGKIVQGGVGSSGNFMYETHWQQHGVDALGIGREGRYVRLHDMNGDGKAGKHSDRLLLLSIPGCS